MVEICANTPLPTFNSLYDQVVPSLTFPPAVGIQLPVLPTIPSPMFPSISVPNLEIVKWISEFQSYQLLSTIMNMIQPMVDFLGIGIESILPNIPGLPFNLLDLLALDPSVLIEEIKLNIDFDMNLNYLLQPFYVALKIPDIEIIQTLSLAVKEYLSMLTTVVEDLIAMVTDELEIPGMPALPTIPSLADMRQMVLDSLPTLEVPEIPDFPTVPTIPEIIEFAAIPGFPEIPSIPHPLIPSVSIPEFEMMDISGAVMSHLSQYALTLCMDFIEDPLMNHLSFSFPTLCLTISQQE